MKYLLTAVCAMVIAVLGVVGVAWFQLQPPERAVVPQRPNAFTLANVTIIEPGLERLSNKTITIEHDLIVEVRDATDSERNTQTKYVLPGLIDSHIHQPLTLGGLPDYFALLYLKHGVTSVRYTGHTDTGYEVERHGQRIAEGLLPGPRVFSCGPIIDGAPPLWPSSISLTHPDQAGTTVSGLAERGVDCIKVYSNLQRDVLSAVVVAAREHQLRIVGHVPTGVTLEESGIDDVQHLIGVPGSFHQGKASNPMLDGWQALTDDRIEEVAQFSVRSGIAHTPTLVFLWSNAMRDRHSELIDATAAHLLPRLFMDVAWLPQETIRLGGIRTPETQEKFRAAYQRALKVIALFHERGVLVQAGTDTANPFLVPGASLIQEIELLKSAGLDNESALATATTIPGKLLGLSKTGLIQTGAPADLLVLREDPTINIRALDEIESVIADGRIYPSAFLDSEIDRYRHHHRNFTWDTLLPIAANLLR